jgi:hypothetical protein
MADNKENSEIVSLGNLKPSQYTASKQSKWTPEEIKEKLKDYKKCTFSQLVANQDEYIGTIVRYFRSGKFRSGGILTKVQVIDEDATPAEGYAGFLSIRPRVRWTAQSKTSEFWVQKQPKKAQGDKKKTASKKTKKATKKGGADINEPPIEESKLRKTLQERWFTTPAKLSGSKKEDKKVYVVLDLLSFAISTADTAGDLNLDNGNKVPPRVVYDRVKNGNKKPYKRKYFVSRLNQKTLSELQAYLVSPE